MEGLPSYREAFLRNRAAGAPLTMAQFGAGAAIMADIPPRRVGGKGANILMLLILLMLVGGLAAWAFRKNPPLTASPSATSAPATVPGGTPQESQPKG